MPKYTINYFNGRGRAELSRLILTVAGVEFTDNRISDWPGTHKAQAPLGQLPYLEVDGVKLPQSIAIARYLAKETGYAGKTNLEQAQADAIVDTVVDAYNAYVDKVLHAAEEKRDEASTKYMSEDVPKHFANLEKLIGSYGKNGHAVGDSLTWADLAVYEYAFNVFSKVPTALDSFAGLKKVKENVEANPKIGAYLKARPTTPF